MNRKHIENITEPKRRAIAPYNFVELPEKVVEAQPLPEQNCYHDYSEHLINGETVKIKRHTGKIECTLTTESALYTRCGWSPKDFAEYGETAFKDLCDEIQKLKANFFINPATNQPIIPGSSIRGMLRTLVEIVSFSKIDKVTNKKLFYRSLGDSALRKIYQANFVENLGDVEVSPDPKATGYRSKVHAGFLRKRGNSYVIEECRYGRIDSQFNSTNTNRLFPSLSNLAIYKGKNSPDQTPIWNLQNKTVYVQIDSQEQNYFFPQKLKKKGGVRHPDLYLRFRKVHSVSFTSAPSLQKGTLVITGDIQYKHLEFVFLDECLKEYSVPEEMIRRFQDDDQITKWQKKAYHQDKPSRGSREQDGYLRDREPVFFLLNNDKTVRFLGRAQMFRLPYNNSPLDFVPLRLRFPNLKILAMYFKMLFINHQSVKYATLIALFPSFVDIADAIFGFIGDKKLNNSKAYAGRVFISDGILKQNQETKVNESWNQEPKPILLSSPKPTTFQHYLVQTSDKKPELKHYASQPPTETEPGETVIRGHKFYWHKDCKIEVPENADTQTSLIKPIDPGIKFKFDIHFENLSDVELGALLWVLSLSNEKYCFSLGMGKPLGMGAVKIDYELHLSDRKERYCKLFDDDNKWSNPLINLTQTEENCVKEFEKFVLDGIAEEDYPKDCDREKLQHLKQLPRIEMLLAMLRCDSASEATYMELEKFKDRKVLPTPLDIRKIEDNRRFPTNSTPSSKTESISKPKPQKKSDRPTKETEHPVNLALQRGLKPTRPKPKPKPNR